MSIQIYPIAERVDDIPGSIYDEVEVKVNHLIDNNFIDAFEETGSFEDKLIMVYNRMYAGTEYNT